jgi:DNA-binding XRE family transcriptional regulator
MSNVSIRDLRQRLGLSQAELASITKVSRKTISQWERGCKADPIKLAPFVMRLREMARHLGVLEKDEELVPPKVRVR